MSNDRPRACERLPDLLYLEDVAEALRTTENAVYQMMSRGHLVMAKPTKRVCILKEDFKEFIRRSMKVRQARHGYSG